MAAPLTGAETIDVLSAAGSVISAAATNSKAVAMLAAAIPARVSTPIATAGAGTLTAAALVGGRVVRSGAPANFTDTVDTAANIIATLPTEAPVNTSWLVFYRNTTPFTATIAAGVGITLTGETIVPPNSTGLFVVTVTSTTAVTIDGVLVVPFDMGPIEANTAITTAGNGTLTAAGLVGGLITRSGPTAAFSDATDSAANIIAALGNSQAGQSFITELVNATAFPQTITAGTGVSLTGLFLPSAIVPANSTARCLVTYVSAGTVTVQALAIAYNAAGGGDPSTTQTFFGSGSGTFLEEGTLAKSVSGAGIAPGGTAGDYVVAVFSIPANSLDGVGNRIVQVVAKGTIAANANSKRVKVIANPTSAVVGSLVVGGTVVEDTGAFTVSGGGWGVSVDIAKYGAANSNTQVATSNGKFAGSGTSSHLGAQAPTLLTATENGTILVAVIINNATTATDATLNTAYATAMN